MSELERGGGSVPQRRRTSRAEVDTGPSGSTLDVDFVASAAGDWSSWRYLPIDVRAVLDRAGHAGERAFASGAVPPEPAVRDGVEVELGHAWTVDHTALTVVDAVRPLDARGRGPWRLTTYRHPFAGQVKERRGTVAPDAPTGRRGPAAAGPDDPGALDVLPAPVRRQLLTTVPDPDFEDERLVQTSERGRPVEEEVCLVRATARIVIAVVATRAITPARGQDAAAAAAALAATPWQVHALTAALGRSEARLLGGDGTALDGPGARGGRRQIG
ncbi:hypothetical protein [Jiangella anatolica]|uniref:Uncharacterized protein n=1 Tax=Jiangella anatolica TaxID=2670374 RepID=A0A2W2BRY8_9ACTN|nr:hypothetical protein [Jiangella anatolica]PZF82778.1 hypothetical protein C1I92_15470 [Jiangella anatolica]